MKGKANFVDYSNHMIAHFPSAGYTSAPESYNLRDSTSLHTYPYFVKGTPFPSEMSGWHQLGISMHRQYPQNHSSNKNMPFHLYISLYNLCQPL